MCHTVTLLKFSTVPLGKRKAIYKNHYFHVRTIFKIPLKVKFHANFKSDPKTFHATKEICAFWDLSFWGNEKPSF